MGMIEVSFKAACEDGNDSSERFCLFEGGEEVDGEEDARCYWKDVCDWQSF